MGWMGLAQGPVVTAPTPPSLTPPAPVQSTPKVARQISPLHLVDASLPPTIIFHGTGDNMVPFSQATSFQQQASRQGAKRVEVVQFDGRGHGFWNANRKRGVDFREVIGDSLSFLRSLDWPTSGVPQPLAERQDREKAVTP